MNTQQLESFVQVAENLNFARAAENLNVTTSAISRQIRSLEDELDTQLLHRSTKSVSLTPAGISFLNDAKDILAKLKFASQKIKGHSTSNIQFLTIGNTYEPALPLISSILSHAKESLPELHPFLRIIPPKICFNLLANNEIDISFGFQEDIPMRDGLKYKELFQIPICCTISSNHAYASFEKVSENQLLTEKIIICNTYQLPSKAATIQNKLNHLFSLENTYLCEDPQTALTMIKAGYGFGILPDISFYESNIVYLPLEDTNTISYGVFYKDTGNNPVLKKFLSLLNKK